MRYMSQPQNVAIGFSGIGISSGLISDEARCHEADLDVDVKTDRVKPWYLAVATANSFSIPRTLRCMVLEMWG